ncbi:DUF6371 domain-containing protein [Adhaeribacter pallidiroseus]|uniref:DUF6371 domain-containing protein n=1 Tax=Adhaeribacter pallidiroseus TaxID=2072847 RepID=A0A369QFY8_9BACT|nr:DUF6371 domain-containing protein [Adhaeribacter pallidiroseus]RDC63614.1 hypothetical protein AHMF7616_02219 [Adhaeribacter pallidiroseus]
MHFKFVASNRFRVAPHCPCGKNNRDGKFSPIILDGIPDPTFGHCHSCGQSFFPNAAAKENLAGPVLISASPKLARTIATGLVKQTLKSYHHNNFALWLQARYPTTADYLLQYFSIGTTKAGGTIFWYQDKAGNYRKPKRIYYKPDGHRVKASEDEAKSKPSPLVFTNQAGYEYCLFGEFQLAQYPATAKIVMVESEKSALIGHVHFPDFIWLATGGAVSLKKERAAVLQGRKVLIIPDMHQTGRDGALRMQVILKSVGARTRIIDMDKDRQDGDDIADILIRRAEIR